MLFAMVISFKAYEVKVQEIKRKAFSLNKRSTLYSVTECHYIYIYINYNYKKILSTKLWPWEQKGLLFGLAER